MAESLKEIADGVVTFRTDRFYDPIVRYSLWKRHGRCALTQRYCLVWNGNVLTLISKEEMGEGGETKLKRPIGVC